MASSAALRVTLLGTGSPNTSLARSQPAALVQWGTDGRILVDAGDGVVRQLLSGGFDLASIEHVALTHMHWDHILGYPGFVWASWSAGRKRLRTIGPDGTEDMHERLVENYFHDQARWATTVGYEPSGWDDVEVRDIGAGWSVELDGCVIDAAAVVHPPMVALAYRFTFGGRRLVISGDCAACDELVSLARSVDLLVADACAAAPALLPEPVRASLVSRLRGFHATPEECVEMATAAGVGHLVLTHLRKDVEPDIDDHQLGVDVTVGSDLQSFVV